MLKTLLSNKNIFLTEMKWALKTCKER